jgi:hypothetical protein
VWALHSEVEGSMESVTPISRVAAIRDRLATLAGTPGDTLDAVAQLHLLDAYTALELANRGTVWDPPGDVPVPATRAEVDRLGEDLEVLIDQAGELELHPLQLGVAARRVRRAAEHLA